MEGLMEEIWKLNGTKLTLPTRLELIGRGLNDAFVERVGPVALVVVTTPH
jgi:hypothetical protein